MAGGQLPLPMPNMSVPPWHQNGHLLHCSCQAHRIHTNICLPREEGEREHDGPQKERERERACVRLARPLPALSTKALMFPVKPLAAIASAQAPLRHQCPPVIKGAICFLKAPLNVRLTQFVRKCRTISSWPEIWTGFREQRKREVTPSIFK